MSERKGKEKQRKEKGERERREQRRLEEAEKKRKEEKEGSLLGSAKRDSNHSGMAYHFILRVGPSQ